MDQIIIDFWKCSLSSDYSDFDFDAAFDEFEPALRFNCTVHGQTTLEEFIQHHDEYYGLNDLECGIADAFTIDNMWIRFTDVDVVEAILKAKFEKFREVFGNNIHGDLAELLERIQPENRPKQTPQLIELFDECIHAEHCNGMIIEDVDLDDLRAQAEEEHKEEQEKFPTDIRKFLV